MNRLRSMTSIQIEFGGNAQKFPSVKKYFLMLKLPQRKRRLNIGEVFIDQPSKEVVHSFLEYRFQGMGLGKKLYGEVLKVEGVLYPDSIGGLNIDSERVWTSLKRRYSHTVKGCCDAMTYGERGLLDNEERWGGVKFNGNTKNVI